MTNLLQSALDVALFVVRANLDVLEGLGAQLEGISCLLTYTVEDIIPQASLNHVLVQRKRK